MSERKFSFEENMDFGEKSITVEEKYEEIILEKDNTVKSLEEDLITASKPVQEASLKKTRDNSAEVAFVVFVGMALFVFLITVWLYNL